jgi:hypothetical protein
VVNSELDVEPKIELLAKEQAMKQFRFVSIALAAILFFTITSWAQTNEGRILGTVRDSSGGVVVGAKVTVTNTGKDVSRELVTNGTGEYIAPSLEPGLYRRVFE